MIVHSNRLAQCYVAVMSPLLFLRFLPQTLCYLTSSRRRTIAGELRRETDEYGIRRFRFFWALLFDPFFVTLFYHRIGAWRAFLCSFTRKDTSTLTISSEIGDGVTMYHPSSTVLNAKRIGRNFTFRNNTTVGNVHDDNSKRPVIGDNVTLGANVVVFGDIAIGDNVVVGAGTLVNKSVPPDSVVVGNPFRIIKTRTPAVSGFLIPMARPEKRFGPDGELV